MEKRAIVLFSGGLDSTACLYWAKKNYEKVEIISFQYGSREDKVIEKVAKKFAELLNVDFEIVPLPFLTKLSKKANSALFFDGSTLPTFKTFDELNDKELTEKAAKAVWIPARNLVFIAIAASIADSYLEPADIIFGANKEEAQTFPDNTTTFVKRMNKALELSCLNKVRLISPFGKMNKKEIVKFLNENNAAISYSSSCYNVHNWTGNGEPIHCGHCESCVRRKRAFQSAGIVDPTIYA